MEEPLVLLNATQAALRSRFDDFHRAFDHRDEAAYRLALADFQDWLFRWTEAEERVLLPALRRAILPERDPQRELRLEYVQLRELTRHVRMQIESRGRMADLLGLVEVAQRQGEGELGGEVAGGGAIVQGGGDAVAVEREADVHDGCPAG